MKSLQWLPATLILALLAGLAVANPSDPIAERKRLMENTKDALGPMIGMAKEEAPFDAATGMAGLATMQTTAEQAGALFPAGSETGGDTEAKSTIWTDRAGFDQAMADFAAAVTAAQQAAPQSVDELKPVLNGVLKTCKGCHDGYRMPKEE